MYISHKAVWNYWLEENKLFNQVEKKKNKAIGRILNNKSQLDKKISSNAFIIRITVNKLQFSMKK